MGEIECGDQIVLFFQGFVPGRGMAQVFEELCRVGLGGVEVDTLRGAGEERAAPVLYPDNREARGAKDHESG